jgi:hypothetical protein
MRARTFVTLVASVLVAAATTGAAPIVVDDLYTPDATVFSVAAPSGLLANDSTAVGGLRVVSFTSPAEGSILLLTSGAFTYTPAMGQSTNVTFDYTAFDDSGEGATGSVTFDLVSTLPQGVDDFYTPDAPTFSVAPASGLLANDTGGIGDLRVVSFTVPSQGSLVLNSLGALTYAPASGQATNETVTYTLADELDRVSQAEVTFDLVSTLPLAVDDDYTTAANTPLVVDAATGLLANDLGGIGDLRVVSFFVPANASATLFSDGSFALLPDAGFLGTIAFDYTIADALDRISTATISVLVGPGTAEVPEPATGLLVGIGSMLVLGRIRRRRS